MLGCVCALVGVFIFSSPSGSCISVEQCEHVVSELQDSMRKAIHLYHMVSDLGHGLCCSRLALQPTSVECMCLLAQGVLLTGCSVTQAAWLSARLHLKLEPGRQELLISNFWIFRWPAMVL